MNYNNWDKCAVVIHRLSSRVMNEQNQSAMVNNCDDTTPLCIEKSFYQCKSNVGQGGCIQICGDCPDPKKLSEKSCEKLTTDLNQQFDSFALSKMFDNKRRYIDYVVTNVLRQVVNHISIDSLHQLSCCLPQTIEEILCNVTDIDSDRLVRILVTEVLQCYSTNAGQLTDWYTFASSIKPLHSSSKVKVDDAVKEHSMEDNPLSKSKKLSKNQESSERVLKSHIKSIFTTTPVPPLVNKEKPLENTVLSKALTPSVRTNTPSINQIPSTETTSQVNSIMNSMTPLSPHSKETFTPVGTKYQSRIKPNQTLVSNETDKIDHEFLPFRERSTSRSNTSRSQTSHRIPPKGLKHHSHHHHHNHRSNKSIDLSSCSDCVLTIHHKHKHKKVYDHHRQHNHHTTTSFDTPSSEDDRTSILSSHSLSSHDAISPNENLENYKQMSVNTSSMIKHSTPIHTKSRQYISSKSVNTEEVEEFKPSNLLTPEHMLLLKVLASSGNAAKHLLQIESPSFQLSLTDAAISSANNEHKISHFINEVEQSTSTNEQLPLSKLSNTINNNTGQLPASLESSTNSISVDKKILRINHYPNMLADFD